MRQAFLLTLICVQLSIWVPHLLDKDCVLIWKESVLGDRTHHLLKKLRKLERSFHLQSEPYFFHPLKHFS